MEKVESMESVEVLHFILIQFIIGNQRILKIEDGKVTGLR